MICTLVPFRLKGTDKIHTEGFSKFLSNIYSILFVPIIAKPGMSSFHFDRCINDITEKMKQLFKKIIFQMKKIRNKDSFLKLTTKRSF